MPNNVKVPPPQLKVPPLRIAYKRKRFECLQEWQQQLTLVNRRQWCHWDWCYGPVTSLQRHKWPQTNWYTCTICHQKIILWKKHHIGVPNLSALHTIFWVPTFSTLAIIWRWPASFKVGHFKVKFQLKRPILRPVGHEKQCYSDPKIWMQSSFSPISTV